MSNLKIFTPTDLESASEVLTTTQKWVAAYDKKKSVLIAKAHAEGVKLTPATDQEFNDVAASLKKAIKTAEDARKPYTVKLQEVVKLFTAEENELKTILSSIEATRNLSVAAYAKEEAELRAKEAAALAIEQEKIQLFADAEEQLRNTYADLLRTDKNTLLSAFETANAENMDLVVDLFESVTGVLEQDEWDRIIPVINSTLITKEDCAAIVARAREGKYDKVAPHYKAEITGYAKHLLSMIPTRKEEIAAGKLESEEAEKIRQEQRELEAANDAATQARLDKEEAERLHAATLQSRVAQANRAAEKPRAIESYEINVMHRNGWAEIFKFYFTHSTEEDLGKVRLDQMKAFAERQAKATGEKITSEHIQYEPKYKAVTVSKARGKVKEAA